jgi:amidohydrolase
MLSDEDLGALERALIAAIDADADELRAVSAEIHANPELQYEEHKAAALLTRKLEARGFEVQRNAAGIATAFTSETGDNDGPTIAILAEYDALRGLGHACGHNLIGTAALGAARALATIADRLPGRVRCIGTPAEEGGGGKVLMVNRGIFDGVDAAMMFHPLDQNVLGSPSLAATTVDIEFHGKASHAAAAPEAGINALDAVIQTYNGVNALRQHLRSDVRIHGVITHGGEAPNIVPAFASARFRVRAADRAYADHAMQRFLACAEGAAKATGARLSHKLIESSAYDNMINNRAMQRVFGEKLGALGFVFEEKPAGGGLGSTDMGNVSQVVPSIHPYLSIADSGTECHTIEFREAAISARGQRAMLDAAKGMALTALNLLARPALLAEVKAEFAARS